MRSDGGRIKAQLSEQWKGQLKQHTHTHTTHTTHTGSSTDSFWALLALRVSWLYRREKWVLSEVSSVFCLVTIFFQRPFSMQTQPYVVNSLINHTVFLFKTRLCFNVANMLSWGKEMGVSETSIFWIYLPYIDTCRLQCVSFMNTKLCLKSNNKCHSNTCPEPGSLPQATRKLYFWGHWAKNSKERKAEENLSDAAWIWCFIALT